MQVAVLISRDGPSVAGPAGLPCVCSPTVSHTDRTKVAFVSSLPHSGSTILDLVLATHPEVVGIGEIHAVLRGLRTLDQLRARVCTCGQPGRRCALWGPVLASVTEATTGPELYAAIVTSARDSLGRTTIADSSKLPTQLTMLATLDVDLRVIRLTRDVRSWAAAMRPTGHPPPLRIPRTRAGVAEAREALGFRSRRTSFGLYRWWYLRNRALDAKLAVVGGPPTPGRDGHVAPPPPPPLARRAGTGGGGAAPPTTVSYEQFATATALTLERLAGFLDLSPEFSTDTTAACTHQLFGSTMRFDPTLRSTIAYDTRWMTDDRLLLPALLLRPVMAYNRRLVHSTSAPLPWGHGRLDQPR